MSETKMVKAEARTYPHSTGEFEIPGLKSDCKMASAIYKDELHVIGGDPAHSDSYRSHYIKHMKFSLDKLKSKDKSQKIWMDEQIQTHKNWDNVPFNPKKVYASSPYDYNNRGLTYSDNTSLVANSTALWLFRVWSDGGNLSIIARKYQSMSGASSNDKDSSNRPWVRGN